MAVRPNSPGPSRTIRGSICPPHLGPCLKRGQPDNKRNCLSSVPTVLGISRPAQDCHSDGAKDTCLP